ncbi:MAG: endonuclease/exonuclease/phosphatase family protein [Clostridia bacterium]|nr:endonuclease/exonuclease/phosphatase family protein [Clostridia bacterium]
MKLKIMTFNLRTDVKNDGVNYFPNRQERILETIQAEQPDLIGFQEAKEMARAFLKKNLSDTYTVLGCGRDQDYRDEACLVAYRTESFDLINLETRFLSTAPTVPGSRYEGSDQSRCSRLFVHAELIHRDMTEPIHFFNTHLDHKGKSAMLLGMNQILQRISGCSGPFVLTGDMNALPDSDCIRMALSYEGMKDATASIPHSFHGYGAYTEGHKIDYIFTNGKPLSAYPVEDIPVEGVYISDHYPICAWLEV